MSGQDMAARTMNGEPARNGPRAHQWRPVPWEVISVIFSVVTVGAVVGGLTLAALGEVREDLRALGTQVTMAEHRMAAVEREVTRIRGWIGGFHEAMEARPPTNE